ncbi:MAG: trypsin-like peptidase domain-containing protein [Rubrivivax sp.]|nr:trypsin-like peptidase domain-containing protein [Rubrivivax sp.]
MAKTLYQILGVTQDSSADDVRAAYARQCERVPPLDPVHRLAAKEAFSTLIHPQRRAAYDASLHGAASGAALPGRAGPGRLPLAAGALLLLVTGGWWALRPSAPAARPAPPAPGRVVFTVAPPSAAAATAAAPIAPSTPTPVPTGAAGTLSAEQIFARAAPSVVRVNAIGAGGEVAAFGSGVVVEAGSVVTNCHVARRGATLTVKHGNERLDARITMADEAHDLCKLSVIGLAAPAVRIGEVASLRVGQKVYAIGSPQGLDLTLSDGMVSSLREVPDGTLVQTTAPISPGSSGGGLFDESGMLVGIVTFQMRAGQNLNFALPADWIATMAPSAPREPAAAPPPPREAPSRASPPTTGDPGAQLHGRWHCFGPLTGNGMEVVLAPGGSVSGTFRGKPIGGRWALNGKHLFLIDASMAVEEMNHQRLVLADGQGRRLVCSRSSS